MFSLLPVVRLLILRRNEYRGGNVVPVGFVHKSLGYGRSSMPHVRGAANYFQFCVRCDPLIAPFVVFHLAMELLYWCERWCRGGRSGYADYVYRYGEGDLFIAQ